MNDSTLALLGGTPAITAAGPHFTWPPIDDCDRRAVAAQLETAVPIPDRSGVVADLEDALASCLGVRHVVTTCTGTAALHSMYAAAGIGPGDEVIIPALTFRATATPLFHLGALPVLADVDDRGQLDLDDAARRITARTKAVVAVHLWGLPENMDALTWFADEHELMLLEDGSHAHGATWNRQMTGTFGTAAAFSLNGPKPLSAGEGGFVATDDTELYYRVLLHGQYSKRCRREIPTTHPLARYCGHRHGAEAAHPPPGRGPRPHPFTRLEDHLAGRQTIAARMCAALDGVPGIRIPAVPAAARASWYALPLRYEPAELGGLPIERFFDALHAEGATEADQPGSTCPLHTHPALPGPRLPAARLR
ncbi:DegT/DnrJ/EryC1/StrS family aminotransferase [Streptomyces rubradiris]|uniref:DegT/DnrJ/EryC1/StrS family aminotransferase n=1 Tax=Streptomyces rubradiris TaxID=285531 RepID=UPI0036E5299D